MKKVRSTNFLKRYLLIMIALTTLIVLFAVSLSPIVAIHMSTEIYYTILGTITALFIYIHIMFIRRIYLPMKKLEAKMNEFENNSNVEVESFFSEQKTILEQIDGLLDVQKSAIEKEHAQIIMKQKMKYAELQNQINPHFLYNTLENIRGQAIVDDNYIIAEMTESLAKFFRYNISKDNDMVKLSQELENIQTYIQIQQYRFRDRFVFHIYNHDNSDLILHCKIPKMTLQPIVENAIFHGLENKIETGHLDVHIEATERKIIVIVADDGVGMNAETLCNLNKRLKYSSKNIEWVEEKENNSGIALENVNNRLRLLYGEDYGITVSSMLGVGTEVVVTLPKFQDN